MGLVAFYDPPKDNIAAVLKSFYAAGIDVTIITGDQAETTESIADQIGLKHQNNSITGEQVMESKNEAFLKILNETHIYSRMFPEAKLKVIDGLKSIGQIVAMTLKLSPWEERYTQI